MNDIFTGNRLIVANYGLAFVKQHDEKGLFSSDYEIHLFWTTGRFDRVEYGNSFQERNADFMMLSKWLQEQKP